MEEILEESVERWEKRKKERKWEGRKKKGKNERVGER